LNVLLFSWYTWQTKVLTTESNKSESVAENKKHGNGVHVMHGAHGDRF
jgi:hypothetical protein